MLCSDRIGDKLVEKLAERMKKLSAGDEKDGHKLPCLFRQSSAQGVIELLEDAVKNGGKLVVGDLKRKGAIVQPHLIDHCPTTTKLFVHKSFGPVLTVTRVNGGNQELIDVVNSSLTNSVYGKDVEDYMQIAKALRTGSAHINGPSLSVPSMCFIFNSRSRPTVQLVDLEDQVDMDDLVGMKVSMDSQIYASLHSTVKGDSCRWCTTIK